MSALCPMGVCRKVRRTLHATVAPEQPVIRELVELLPDKGGSNNAEAMYFRETDAVH